MFGEEEALIMIIFAIFELSWCLGPFKMEAVMTDSSICLADSG